MNTFLALTFTALTEKQIGIIAAAVLLLCVVVVIICRVCVEAKRRKMQKKLAKELSEEKLNQSKAEPAKQNEPVKEEEKEPEAEPVKEEEKEPEAEPVKDIEKASEEEPLEEVADESEYYSVTEDPAEQATGVNYYDEYDGPYEAIAADDNLDEAKEVEGQVSITDENGDIAEMLKRVNYAKGIAYVVRYRKSFTARLIQSWDESKTYYGELRNEILSYKGVKSRVSWNYESFNFGGSAIIKIDVRGKTLCLYYSLNPDDYANSKYKVERTEIKKVEDVPCLYRIKNPTRVSNAKELIAVVAERLGLEKGKVKNTEYSFPYEPTPVLVDKGLAKEYLVKEKYNDFLERQEKSAKEAEVREKKIKQRQDRGAVAKMRRGEVSVGEVNGLISDEVAAELVEDERTPATRIAAGKKDIINIDTIAANFERGEIVNIDSLKAKGLIPQNASAIKVLARGMLTKPLTIEAQDFSLEAIKMIALTGGTAVKV